MENVDQYNTRSKVGDAAKAIGDQNYQTASKLKQDRGQSASPRHLVPVHDQQQDLKAFTSSPSFPAWGLAGLALPNKPESPSTSAWSTDDFTYPGIPFQVAHYMCESSPDLLHQVEAALHGTHSYEKKISKVILPSKSSSPFFHMCSTTDALALQESVIDGSCSNPAAPDVVAQVVANTYHQRYAEDSSQQPNSNHSAGTISSVDLNVRFPDAELCKELHPFPKDRITTVIERRSWLSGGTQSSSMPSNGHEKSTFPEPSDQVKFPLLEQTGDRRIGSTSKNVETLGSSGNIRDSLSTTSDMEFVSSECFEMESNFSERLELQSNMSEMSGVDEEMARIRKYLLEVSPQVYSPDQFRNYQEVASNNLDLLRAKATLEGQVEALLLEVDRGKQEREQLHTQLLSAWSSSSAQAARITKAQKEGEMLKFKLDELEGKLRESEGAATRLSCVLDAKTDEALQYREEANLTEKEAQQARIVLTELKVEVESKDGAIRGLKNKIAELHVELQTLLGTKANIHAELESCKGQLASEKKMKDWYKLQLQESQAIKSRMQQEVIAIQNTKADCDSLAEKLRFERDQAKKQLAELQEKAVREKEGLLRHLQNIESDMQEREASFQQLHTDKDLVEGAVMERMRKVEEERARLTEEKISRHEIEHQLQSSLIEVETKTSLVAKLEKDVSQLMKQVTVVQKTLNDSELERHSMREVQAEQEGKIKELLISLQTREENLDSVKKGAVALEIELRAVRHEKLDMDDTLTEVRENILKLDSRLRQMKDELTAKVSMISQLRQEKAVLVGDVKLRDMTIEEHKRMLLQLEDQLKRLKKECDDDHVSKSELNNEKVNLANGLLRASELCDPTFNAFTNDSINLEAEVRGNSHVRTDVSTKGVFFIEECIEVGGGKVQHMAGKVNSDELSLCLEKHEHSPVSCAQEQVNQRLHFFDADTQTESSIFLVEDTVSSEERASQNDAQLKEKEREHKERCRRYESNINVLTKKLRASLKSSKKSEMEIKALERKLAEMAANSNASEICDAQRSQSQNGGKSRDAKLYYFRKRIALLENKMTEMQRVTEEEKQRADGNQQMLVELEKERSRLQTIAENSKVQTENMTEFRFPSSDGRYISGELDAQSRSLETWKEHIESELRESLKDAKKKLSTEQEKGLDLRKLVFKEKLESSKLGKQVASLKAEVEELRRLLEAKRLEAIDSGKNLEEQQQLALKLKAEMGELQVKLSQCKNEVSCLGKELEEGRAKDPVLADQIKTLGWHLQQKNQELGILKDQHKQMDAHYHSEVQRLTHALQNTKQELENVKTELQSTLNEKIEFQTKGTEMRAALKLSVERNKALQVEYKKYLSTMDVVNKCGSNLLDFQLAESPAPYDESLIASLLRQSISLPESRPLNNLHMCLNTLKQEMAILHQQILEQADLKS